jgi:amylosucrase
MHRPPMDWAAAERRHEPGSVEAALWHGLRGLMAARRATRATHAQGKGRPLPSGNDHVYALLREFAGERMLLLANFSAAEQRVARGFVEEQGFGGGEVVLAPYRFAWIPG